MTIFVAERQGEQQALPHPISKKETSTQHEKTSAHHERLAAEPPRPLLRPRIHAGGGQFLQGKRRRRLRHTIDIHGADAGTANSVRPQLPHLPLPRTVEHGRSGTHRGARPHAHRPTLPHDGSRRHARPSAPAGRMVHRLSAPMPRPHGTDTCRLLRTHARGKPARQHQGGRHQRGSGRMQD